MSEERLRRDINRLKRLTNGCIPEFHQDIEDVLDRLEQYKSVLDEIREYINNTFTISSVKDMYKIMDGIEEILDKVKE